LTLASELVERHMASASDALRNRWRGVAEDLLNQAVVDAILELSLRSAEPDPAKGGWGSLIVGAAGRRLADLLRGEGRRKKREETAARVAEARPAERDPGRRAEDAELAALGIDGAAGDAAERAFLELYAEGVDDPDRLAAALGLSVADPPDRDAAVKRVRDRLLKRLGRIGERWRRKWSEREGDGGGDGGPKP
jgi:hypothetical protein